MKSSLHQPLQSIFWPSRAQFATNAILVLAGTALLAVASQIAIPFQPVPMTLQTLAVLFLSMALGWRLGLSSVMLYLLLGAVGLPIFSGLTAGTAILFGTTSGYLFGFIAAAAFTGWLVQRGWGKHFWTVALTAIIGEIIIFAAGLSVLSFSLGFKGALAVGFMPFLSEEMIKIAILAVIIPPLWKNK